MFLNAQTDHLKLQQLAPVMREPMSYVLHESQRRLDEADPGLYEVHIFEAHRSDAKQLERYAKGRAYDAVTKRWREVDKSLVVTNAMPGETAHSVLAADGQTPAALAADFWILSVPSGKLLPDGHLAWAFIPAAAHSAPLELESGAFFRIGGGDWPHLQHATWKDLVLRGRLRG